MSMYFYILKLYNRSKWNILFSLQLSDLGNYIPGNFRTRWYKVCKTESNIAAVYVLICVKSFLPCQIKIQP